MIRALLPALAVLALSAGEAAAEVDEAERDCVALAVYFEALAEGRAGMEAVAAVIQNRMASEEFPAHACDVVKEGGETPPCQFRWWCDGESDQPEDQDAYAMAREVATRALGGELTDPTDGALFFHSTEVDSPFEVPREQTTTIGEHVFYR